MNLLDGAPLEVLGDVGPRPARRARVVLAGVARDLDGAAHLAVDLDAQRHQRVEGQRLVVGRPGRLEQEAFFAQALPGLVAQVGRVGADQLDQRQQILARGAARLPVSSLTYSIMAAMAVLNCMRSRSAVTRLMVLWRRLRCGSAAGARAGSNSSTRRQTRLRKRLTPFDGARVPGLGQLELAHEHLVEAHHVGAVVADDVVGVDAVHLGLGHLLDGDLERLARRLQHGLVAARTRRRRARGSAPWRPGTSRPAPCPGGAAS